MEYYESIYLESACKIQLIQSKSIFYRKIFGHVVRQTEHIFPIYISFEINSTRRATTKRQIPPMNGLFLHY